jgi:hypothetical protein
VWPKCGSTVQCALAHRSPIFPPDLPDMASKIALALVVCCALVWPAQATSLQEEFATSIPLEAWEAAACSASGGNDEDCQLHLLQLRAQGVAGMNATTDATVRAKQPRVSEVRNVSAQSTGRCTDGEHMKMTRLGGGHSSGSFPYLVATCAKKALGWFTFHRGDMTRCLSKGLGVSISCAGCYSYIGQYGYDHCKTQCVLSTWCGSGCLGCTTKSHPTVDSCAGSVAPEASVC